MTQERPARRRYSVDEMLAGCDFSQPLSPEAVSEQAAWLNMPSIGHEHPACLITAIDEALASGDVAAVVGAIRAATRDHGLPEHELSDEPSLKDIQNAVSEFGYRLVVRPLGNPGPDAKEESDSLSLKPAATTPTACLRCAGSR